jgi:hypothetical protein
MKTFIPKQQKRSRERIEAKLDSELLGQLQRYCEYLESDRDYVLSSLLELTFKKDKGFAEWLKAKDQLVPAIANVVAPAENGRKSRFGGM